MMTKKEIIEILKSIKLPMQEDYVSDAFGKIAFGDPNTKAATADAKSIAKLQGIKMSDDEPGERDTKIEVNLYDTLFDWVKGETSYASKKLYKYKDLIKQAQRKFPTIFKPSTPVGTVVYRGIGELNDKLLDKLKNTSKSFWKTIVVNRRTYMVYTKPISYTPRSIVQSWTHDMAIAGDFAGDALLISKQDSEFLFNQEFMKILYPKNEKEQLHFGKEYKNKIFIAVTKSLFFDVIFPNDYSYKVASGKSIGKTLGLK